MDLDTGVTTATPAAAPSSPAPAPSSAPAASADPSAQTTGGSAPPTPTPSKPRTMAEGFEQEFAKLASHPAEPTTPDASSAGPDQTTAETTTTPPEGEQKPPAQKPKWIPYERHEAIIENARQKARSEIISEVGQRLGWAVNYKPDQVSAAMQVTQQMAADPVAFALQMLREISSVPELKQKLVAHRAAASGPPPPDMVTNDGKHRFYSAEGQARRDAWMEQRIAAKFEQRLAPFEENLQQQRSTERETQVRSVARAHLDEMATRPLFVEHAHEIIAAMEADGRVTVQSAYDRIVLPKLATLDKEREARIRREEKEATLAELRQKAGAGSFNPGSPSAPQVGHATLTPTADGFKEGFRREFARLGGKL